MDPELVPLLINVMIGVVISDLVIVAYVTARAIKKIEERFYLFWILVFSLFTVGDSCYLMFLLSGASFDPVPLAWRITSRTVLSFVVMLIYLAAFELEKLKRWRTLAWIGSMIFFAITAIWSFISYDLLPSKISIIGTGIIGTLVYTIYPIISKDKRYWVFMIAYVLEMVGGIIFALENPIWFGMPIAVIGNFMYMIGSGWLTEDRRREQG